MISIDLNIIRTCNE